jgi:hypothetical protein
MMLVFDKYNICQIKNKFYVYLNFFLDMSKNTNLFKIEMFIFLKSNLYKQLDSNH